MNTLRSLSITLLLALCMISATAQQYTVRFDYDAAGNRTERWLEVQGLKLSDSLFLEAYLPAAEAEDNELLGMPDGLPTQVYPNPVYGLLTVDMPGKKAETVPYFLFDPQGKTVLQGEIAQITSNIDLTQLQPGTYYLLLLDGNRQERFKLIKH
jgi:hypothetical protein